MKLHFLAFFAQRPPEKVRSTTGLDSNQLHLQIRGEGQQLGARTSLADHHLTCRMTNKSDYLDAEAIVEAVQRGMKPANDSRRFRESAQLPKPP